MSSHAVAVTLADWTSWQTNRTMPSCPGGGWEDNPYSRAAIGYDQRYDQIFVSNSVGVNRTSVMEDRYVVTWGEQQQWVYASDHLPVVADLALPHWSTRRSKMRLCVSEKNFKAGGKFAPRTISMGVIMAFVILGVIGALLVGLMLWMIWDMAGGSNLECRLQCRNILEDPPFDPICPSIPNVTG